MLTHAALPHLLTDWEVRQQPQCGCCFTLSRRWRLCGSRYNFRTLHQGGVSCTTFEHHGRVSFTTFEHQGRVSYTSSEHYTKGGSPVQLPNTTLREGLLYNFRTSREDLLYNFRTLHHKRISCIQPRARPLLVGYKENIKMIFPWFKIQTKKNP